MQPIIITCLIYKSTKYADSIWNSTHKHTPHLKDGRAKFLFIANDASDEVKNHLICKGYPFVVQENEKLNDAQLKEKNIAPPEYVRRIYQGFNRAIQESGDIVALLSSDMPCSPNWFDYLLREHNENRVVVSKLVERRHPRFGIFKGAFEGDFGSHPDNFREDDFIDFAHSKSRKGVEKGGGYTPCVMLKSKAIEAGLFPEGNIARINTISVDRYGDFDFFTRLKEKGVEHLTVTDSIVYHFKEGEMNE